MTDGYLMEVPLDDGENRMVVEVASGDLPQDLMPAAKLGEVAAKAGVTLESALDDLRPGLKAVADWADSIKPAEFTVECGLKFGGQAGLVVARGTAEVNFVVTLTWKK
jgi:NTP-dependent ternary system trypsin peptidase co-occuring protein